MGPAARGGRGAVGLHWGTGGGWAGTARRCVSLLKTVELRKMQSQGSCFQEVPGNPCILPAAPRPRGCKTAQVVPGCQLPPAATARQAAPAPLPPLPGGCLRMIGHRVTDGQLPGSNRQFKTWACQTAQSRPQTLTVTQSDPVGVGVTR